MRKRRMFVLQGVRILGMRLGYPSPWQAWRFGWRRPWWGRGGGHGGFLGRIQFTSRNIYIYIVVCVCVCVYVYTGTNRIEDRRRKAWEYR